MRFIRGTSRLIIVFIMLILITLLVLATAWIPVRIKGARLSAWLLPTFCRLMLPLFNVQFTALEAERIRQHDGFIFPNHLSFLDIILLISIFPLRFVSKAEIANWPFVGWVARAVDTVFVKREDKDSREKARDALAQLRTFPAVALFPEGGIYQPPDELKPFRYGAFEIAQAGGAAFIPAVFIYEPLDIVFWRDEHLLTAVWRFASRPEPVKARLFLLRTVHPAPEDDPRQLALESHGAMAAVYKHGGNRGSDVIQSGI
ncbi:lysophospholipid acyltransferase family protein [Candidatus Leptofilum sp.]|uniref:lysophospholipid acyltransferase family protein n=1 Tax=Candidatus Leptofilum sp. TaxID=3241576 RepID=UPI003B5BD281